jgi:DnaJ-class molecular chaperone
MTQADYYATLKVSETASAQEIKAAYRKLAFEYHPDRTGGNTESADRMKAVNEAYAVLSDEDKRREYDTLRSRFGASAAGEFRKTYSQEDIFRGSDIQGIFEEMARSFGLRGFEDIFKEFYGNGYHSFRVKQSGGSGGGIFFGGTFGTGRPGRGKGRRIGRGMGRGLYHRGLGKLTEKMVEKITGATLPKNGEDQAGAISLSTEEAARGGPFAYFYRKQGKKLVVKIPPGIRHGQRIRLAGLGSPGTAGGRPGDLYLRIRIRKPLVDKLKKLAGDIQKSVSQRK